MSVEQSFDSQDFAKMVLDREHFRARMPLIVSRVIETFGIDASTRRIESQPMEQMLGNVKTLWNDGSKRLLFWVYGEYCRDNGVSIARDSEMFGTVNVSPSIRELSPEELNGWEAYLGSGDISRNTAVGAFYHNFGFMFPGSLPSLRYESDERVRALHQVVESIPYKVIASVLPDLTDDEAKRLFGQLTPAAEVFRKAEITPISGEF